MRRFFERRALAATATLAIFVVAIAACAPTSNPELQWARAALERNPQVKVLEVDEANNSIKVRVMATGEVISVAPGELAGIPIAQLVELAHTANSVAATAAAAASVPAPTMAPVPQPQPEPEETITVPDQPKPPPSYTVQREDGRIKVSGPGVSIETVNKPTSQQAMQVSRADDPIVCDGKMLLHLDGKTINAGGDAVIARGGCDLHITNSRISANGTALTVLDATVHVANSELQGDDGSLTASSAAQLYIRSSRFTGLARRDPQATIQDQGGNTWR